MSAPSSTAHAEWVGLQHPITYSPSATLWWEAQHRVYTNPTTGGLLAIGDPVYHEDACSSGGQMVAARGKDTRADLLGENWSRLCYSSQEVQAIQRSRRIGPHEVDMYLTGAGATEDTFHTLDLSRFSILHFSTHGVAFSDAPLRSAVVLGQNLQPPVELDPEDPSLLDNQARDGYLEL